MFCNLLHDSILCGTVIRCCKVNFTSRLCSNHKWLQITCNSADNCNFNAKQLINCYDAIVSLAVVRDFLKKVHASFSYVIRFVMFWQVHHQLVRHQLAHHRCRQCLKLLQVKLHWLHLAVQVVVELALFELQQVLQLPLQA